MSTFAAENSGSFKAQKFQNVSDFNDELILIKTLEILNERKKF